VSLSGRSNLAGQYLSCKLNKRERKEKEKWIKEEMEIIRGKEENRSV
jgi:hypothetical protein